MENTKIRFVGDWKTKKIYLNNKKGLIKKIKNNISKNQFFRIIRIIRIFMNKIKYGSNTNNTNNKKILYKILKVCNFYYIIYYIFTTNNTKNSNILTFKPKKIKNLEQNLILFTTNNTENTEILNKNCEFMIKKDIIDYIPYTDFLFKNNLFGSEN